VRNFSRETASSQHMRAATVCLLALAVVTAGVVPGATSAKTAKRPATACEKLAKRYKDRSADRRLVLVVRGDDETGNISSCILPRGKVRTLASWDDGLSRDGARIIATSGWWAIVEETHNDQYGGTSRSLTRVDARGGRRLLMSGYGCQVDYTRPVCDSGTNAGEVVMAPSGAGALELTEYATHRTSLRAFSAAGAITTLAEGAVDALRIAGSQIVWTQAGVEHAAPLP
jgi:hypothetical protein